MLALRLGAVDEFPFLDRPRPEAVSDGYKTLFELGAIDEDRQLTEIGMQLSRMPIDPRVGRMILAADSEGCLHEMLIIAAALEVQDPRDRPVDKKTQADEAHSTFAHEESDFLTYLTMWDFYHGLREKLSRLTTWRLNPQSTTRSTTATKSFEKCDVVLFPPKTPGRKKPHIAPCYTDVHITTRQLVAYD